VIDPLVACHALIELRAERAFVGIPLRTLIDERALLARERRLLVIGLEEVLTNLGANELEQKAQMADQRIVSQHGALPLQRVAQPEHDERGGSQRSDSALAGLRPSQAQPGSERDRERPCRVADGNESVDRIE
jgi:hypothetical protein